MQDDFGATQDAWHHWAVTLGLCEDLLPVVANPGAEVSKDSKMQALGKTPSKYNFKGKVVGIPKWTEHRASAADVQQWARQPDYGICLQTRRVRAIDVDVEDARKAAKVRRLIEREWPLYFLPERRREGTGKTLFLFRMETPLEKRVIKADGGMIEILADGQQCVVDSTYLKNGEAAGRYEWLGGAPLDIPVVSRDEFDHLWAALVEAFATEPPLIARAKRKPVGLSPRVTDDPVGRWLSENWEVRDEGRNGELYIQCPFEDEHSSYSGPTETVYFAPGTGGYERGHFKCLHAHCAGRDDGDFLLRLGYHAAGFPQLPAEVGPEEMPDGPAVEEDEDGPKFITDRNGRKEVNTYNFVLFLQTPELCGRRIAWDEFTAQLVWHPLGKTGQWRVWRDTDYASMAIQMDRNGFKTFQPSALRPAVYRVAESRSVDLAIEWANRLPAWDGVKRMERFLPDYLHAADTPYTRAVGRYIWTAQAGRLMDPGCQADMAPVLVGKQDRRKSSIVQALAPAPDMFVDLDLSHRDDDTSRKLRGVLVAELGELRGLRGRDLEDVKAFVTRRIEKWVPKYQEFSTMFKRRCILYGTTNAEEGFLNDTTGERRWLPFEVCIDGIGRYCEVEKLIEDREQLWAEGIAYWLENGIAYQDAERMARAEHGKFKMQDPWTPIVAEWLIHGSGLTDPPVDRPFEWGTREVLIEAIGKRPGQMTTADQMRAGAVLMALGATKRRAARGWRYAINMADLKGWNV